MPICEYCRREAHDNYQEIAGIMCDKCYKSKSYPRLEQMKPTSKTNDWESEFDGRFPNMTAIVVTKDGHSDMDIKESVRNFIKSELKSQREEPDDTNRFAGSECEMILDFIKSELKSQREEFIRELEDYHKHYGLINYGGCDAIKHLIKRIESENK